ncbi:MAG TPA: LCCL domain-containing protein [Rubricoccaceae bacterium]|nr:LCCL domain-containing protein [Rubricoccaceae bacterium]
MHKLFALLLGGAFLLGGCMQARQAASSVQAFTASWGDTAAQHRGHEGMRIAYLCPPGGTAHTVWGSGPYTDDSSVCTAAVHAGVITFASGGRVVISMRPGRGSYSGSTRNGVTTLDYGEWGGSFDVRTD